MNNTPEALYYQYINNKQYLLETHPDMLLDILSREAHQKHLNTVEPFRARTYTPLKTLHAFIQQALSSDKSSRNAVAGVNISRLLSEKSAVGSNSGCYVKAKKRLEEGTIHELVRSVGVGSLNKAPRAWGFDGRDIKAFDGTTLTLRDTKANNAQYPKHSNQKPGVGNPQVRLLGVFSLMTGSVIDYALEATRGKGTGEVTLFRSLLDCIKEGDIALGDALFCHFFLMHDLMEKKVDVLVPGHVQRRYDFTTGLILGENDCIREWKKPRRPKWMSKELYKQYPKTIQIREFKIHGVVYMTTFTDASKYPKKQLLALYKRRWEVELHIRSIKTHMEMDNLTSQTPDRVRKEIGVHLLAYNIIREIMTDGGIQANALPTQMSFKGTLQLFNQFNPHFSLIPKDKKEALYSQMLALIASNKVGKRPGRVEPRAVRKKTQSFPTLKNHRAIEKEKILAQRARSMVNNQAA